MIYLFNLNEYLGGGEVFVAELSSYMSNHDIENRVICAKGSYISKKLNNKNTVGWSAKSDNISYASKPERQEIYEVLDQIGFAQEDIVLANSMRELYILISYYKYKGAPIPNIKLYLLHPEEFKFLSLLQHNKKGIERTNKQILKELYEKDSLLFPNENGMKMSLDFFDEQVQTYPFSLYDYSEEQHVVKIPADGQEIRLLCISRFVTFKVSTVLSLIKNLPRENTSLTIIGYGSWNYLVKAYVFFYSRFRGKNIVLQGKKDPDELHKYILDSHVGVAQGTAILQFIKFGIPVIIAPYSKWYHFLFKEVRFAGIFGENGQIEFGDVYHKSSFQGFKRLFDKLMTSYPVYQKATIALAKNKLSKKVTLNNLSAELKKRTQTIDVNSLNLAKPYFIKYLLKRL